VIEGAYLLRVITRLYAAPGDTGVPTTHRAASLFASGLFATALLAAAVFVDPLWLTLSDLAAQGIDTGGYVQTVLGSVGGTQ
jgi:hypothetical protein